MTRRFIIYNMNDTCGHIEYQEMGHAFWFGGNKSWKQERCISISLVDGTGVRMCVCWCVCVGVCLCVLVSVGVLVCVLVCLCVNWWVCVCVCEWVCVCEYMCVWVCDCVSVSVCVCVCVEMRLVESLGYIKAGKNLTDYLSTSHQRQLFVTRW